MTFTESTLANRPPIRPAFLRPVLLLFTCFVSAVGAFPAAATASAAVAGGTGHQVVQTWTATQAPVPDTAAANPVTSPRQVTCAAPGECVGVGSYNSKSGYAAGLIERLHDGSWTATTAPLPRSITPPQKVTLTSVSCPATDSCGVSGFLDTPSTRRSELLTLGHGRWVAQAAPLLPQTLGDSQTLSAISCPRPGRCVAVGRYQGGAHGYYEGLIEVQAGRRWHAVEAPLPADATTTADPFGGVDWVSCPQAGQCTTVGAYVDSKGNRELFADVLAGGAWRSSRLPLPAKVAANPLAYLGYVTCLAPGQCLAAGNFDATGSDQHGLFETEVAGKWHATSAPAPAGTPADADVTMNAASCPTAAFCAATGDYQDTAGNHRGILETLSGGKWHAVLAPAPASDRTNRYLEAVSCPVDGWCVATGSTNINGLLETYASGHWKVTAAPLPNEGTFAIFQGTSVSCPSDAMCAAFGLYAMRGSPTTQQGLLETYAG
jgi:hypothetical protein